jgi:hypothetical protein
MRLKYSNTLFSLLGDHRYLPYLTAYLKHVFVSSLAKRRQLAHHVLVVVKVNRQRVG